MLANGVIYSNFEKKKKTKTRRSLELILWRLGVSPPTLMSYYLQYLYILKG